MLKAARSLRPDRIRIPAGAHNAPILGSCPGKGIHTTPIFRGLSSRPQQQMRLSSPSKERIPSRLEEDLHIHELNERLSQADLDGLDALEDFQLDGDWSKTKHVSTSTVDPSSNSGMLKPSDANIQSPNADAGDPLGCDSAEMRTVKSHSCYAWVCTEISVRD